MLHSASWVDKLVHVRIQVAGDMMKHPNSVTSAPNPMDRVVNFATYLRSDYLRVYGIYNSQSGEQCQTHIMGNEGVCRDCALSTSIVHAIKAYDKAIEDAKGKHVGGCEPHLAFILAILGKADGTTGFVKEPYYFGKENNDTDTLPSGIYDYSFIRQREKSELGLYDGRVLDDLAPKLKAFYEGLHDDFDKLKKDDLKPEYQTIQTWMTTWELPQTTVDTYGDKLKQQKPYKQFVVSMILGGFISCLVAMSTADMTAEDIDSSKRKGYIAGITFAGGIITWLAVMAWDRCNSSTSHPSISKPLSDPVTSNNTHLTNN